MSIDERLDRLTERHEALTPSVEMLTSDLHEMRGIVVQILGGIDKLANVTGHERRLGRLENGD